jgi:hypothetical protein
VVSTVTWRAGGENLSDVASGLAFGGCLAALGAFLVEAIMVGAIAIGVIAFTDLERDVLQLLESFATAMESAGPGAQVDPGAVTAVLLEPLVLLSAFAVFGFGGPLAEELFKGAAALPRRPVTRYQAWFWGTAAGAGFGIVEAVTLGGLLTSGWIAGMLVRSVTMVMHATMSGAATLGWFAILQERRRTAGVVLLGAAIAGHMAWNSLVLGSVVAGVASALYSEPLLLTLASGFILALIALFVTIFLSFRVTAHKLGEEGARSGGLAGQTPPQTLVATESEGAPGL